MTAPTAAPTDHPLLDEELHALVDGQLTPVQEAALRARLAHDASAAATLAAWQSQRAALQGLQASMLDEPVPDSLLAAATRVQEQRHSSLRWQRWGGMAAGLGCAFVLGWAVRGAGLAPPQPMAAQARPSSFVQQASMAHLVYAPEVRHPVEVAAAQQEHLVQWLSKRLGRPLKLPDLSAQGFELVGGRLLPGEGGARAQFMFQAADGQRVTLYLGAVEAAAAAPASAPPAGATAFQLSTEPLPSFYWVDQGFGYALSGELPRERLLALAQAVYRQL